MRKASQRGGSAGRAGPAVAPGHLAGHLLGVDGHDDALRAEPPRAEFDQVGVVQRGRVQRHLVGPGVEQRPHVVLAADAAADGEGDEEFLGAATGEFDDGVPLLVRGGDVQEDQLVGALDVVAGGEFDRVAGVADVDEVGAFDHATLVDVQAGDDPFEVHVAESRSGVQDGQGLRHGEAPLVERPPGDDPGHAIGFEALEHPQVVERGDATRGDDAQGRLPGQVADAARLTPCIMPSRPMSV